MLINPRTVNAPAPPLGILYIAAVLREAGHEVSAAEPDPDDHEAIAALTALRPDIVGLSIMTTQVELAHTLVGRLRQRLPRSVFVGGGIHPTALPEWSLRNLELDYVVIGEGEETMRELCDALKNSRDVREVAGLAFIDDENGYRQNAPRAFIQELSSLPLPARDLIDFKKYLRPPGNIRGVFLKRATALLSGRGCPFTCTFCASHRLFGRTVRMRTVADVMREIDWLVKTHAIDGFWLLDDTLLQHQDWAFDFCRALQETGYGLIWGCQTHVLKVSLPLLQAMKAAGCVQLEFGVESGSLRILKRLRKGTTPEATHEAFRIARQAGLRTLANFMIGNPDETSDDLELTFRLAKKIKPNHVVATFTTPLPGSCLFEEALSKGWISPAMKFSVDMVIRQIERPAVSMSLPPEILQAFRTRFDNYFFIQNHIDYLKHPDLIVDITKSFLRHPKPYLSGLGVALRTHRLSHFLETIWNEYNRV